MNSAPKTPTEYGLRYTWRLCDGVERMITEPLGTPIGDNLHGTALRAWADQIIQDRRAAQEIDGIPADAHLVIAAGPGWIPAADRWACDACGAEFGPGRLPVARLGHNGVRHLLACAACAPADEPVTVVAGHREPGFRIPPPDPAERREWLKVLGIDEPHDRPRPEPGERLRITIDGAELSRSHVQPPAVDRLNVFVDGRFMRIPLGPSVTVERPSADQSQDGPRPEPLAQDSLDSLRATYATPKASGSTLRVCATVNKLLDEIERLHAEPARPVPYIPQRGDAL